jgi:hypothetical protein
MAGRDTLPHHLGPKEETARSVKRKRKREDAGNSFNWGLPEKHSLHFVSTITVLIGVRRLSWGFDL